MSVFTGLVQLSDRQKIDFSVTRLDSNQHLGIRFMIHNDGKNYYQLEFYRRNGNGYRYPAWVLEKITDGKAVRLKTGYGFGNQSWNTGTVKFSLIIDRGNISWTAQSDTMFDEFCGSFIDSTPFSIAENDATFGFFGYVVKNNVNESYNKSILINDVAVTGLSCYDSVEHDIFNTESYELSYSLNGDNTLTVDGFMQKPLAACDLVIPSHADTYVDANGQTIKLAEPVRVKNIAKEAFFENDTANKQSELIKSVYIENGIQKIGDNAFRNCISIGTARVPGSAALGYGVFKGCMGLRSIVLENGITSLPGRNILQLSDAFGA